MRPFATLALTLALVRDVLAGGDDASADSFSHMIEKVNNLRTHSLAPPYVDSDLQNRWWDFGADTIINTNKHVRLVQDKPSQNGYLWSRMPLSVMNWQIEFEFKVDGSAHNIYGDGFALWISKDRAKVGPVFGSVDYFTGLGIFFDTYANSRHSYSWPRISAMMGDGKTKYDHDNDNADNEIGGCSEHFRRRDFPTKARLTYLKSSLLQLQVMTRHHDEWSTCFEIEAKLPDQPYIGFTAATGDVSDDHDIITVTTNSITLTPEHRPHSSNSASGQKVGGAVQAPMAVPTDAAGKKVKRKTKSGSGGAANAFLFVLKMIGVLAFIAFAWAALRTYNAQQKSKRTW
ncbi:lectin [Dioszegia hungarica]|uniref:Lectin n=1 Tax=Dioszegia hungarica TaxID=4972 RepID=A0AA38H6X9_9TREE|nr:lectin [Dioszegia hungarica]KAI9633926.1 lectin [Dioszegia hungarica]